MQMSEKRAVLHYQLSLSERDRNICIYVRRKKGL